MVLILWTAFALIGLACFNWMKKVSGGLHGVGLSVVNALSDVLEVYVWRDSKKYSMRFARGIPQTGLLEAKDSGRGNGTTVRFHPDPQIFERGLLFQRDVLANRLRELSFLNAGLRIVLKDDRILEAEDHDQKRSVEYKHDGGIKEYIALMCKDKTNLHTKPIFFSATRDGMTAEVVLQWCSDSYSESIFGFVNNIKTIDGGTHIDGFKFALSKAINNLGKSTGKLKSSIGNLSGEFIREGLTAILSVKVPNPEFEGQTKTKLGNPEVRDFMRKIVEEELSEYFDLNVKIFADILEKATQAHNAANAARSARELVRRKNFLETSTLPGKLADCSSRDPYNSEIFIVEGESAGGSAKQARNRENQAILPLRGKILNVERTDDSRLYANSEVQALIQALGLGFRGEVLEIPKLRYHRIIIMTDADVDGAHIRTLLLTLFFRYQRELITEGLVYIACPPLYKLEVGLKTYFTFTPEQLEKEIAKHASGRNHRTMRFKGLGEMMATELWDTTMNPQKRVLRQVTVEDAMEAETMFSLLMGDNVLHRREYIQSRADEIELEELDI
uniref:DNA topoisomerase 2 n=1 Tax=Rhodosorus marinus TaxID=101924 RepID=A0A7S3AB64_9RHOD|mmetsp:Transcript_7767/g.34519  ORF Transcript_7767/g.34519 Transcript_7767/m.34519 type:complete len:560 (+) Transcript_7767:35-1714(+)